MTFIAAFIGPAFAGLTDVAISVEKSEAAVWASQFPMHDHPPESGSRVTVAFAMKAIIIDPQSVFMYSGRQDVCLRFLNFVTDALRLDREFDFIRLCKDFNEGIHPLDEEHFIFNQIKFRNEAQKIVGNYTSTWQIYQGKLGEVQAYTAGSGIGDLVDRLNFTGEGEMRDPRVAPWLARLLGAVTQEMTDGSPLGQGYGGWFELTVEREGRFEKFPYSILCWHAHENGEIELVGPVIGSKYYGHSLLIHRVNMDGGKFREHITWISDPLNRDIPARIEVSTEEILDTQMHIHLIFDGSNNICLHVSLNNDHTKMIDIKKSGDRLTYNVQRELYESLKSTKGQPNLSRLTIEPESGSIP